MKARRKTVKNLEDSIAIAVQKNKERDNAVVITSHMRSVISMNQMKHGSFLST